MKKLIDTIKFYYSKVVKVIDISLDAIVKTVEVILGKIPQAIEDAYRIIVSNVTAQNLIALAIAYIIFGNFAVLAKSPVILALMLVTIALMYDKLNLK